MKLYSMEFELPALATILLLILCLFYFSKKRISLIENKTYEVMLVSSTISSFLDMIIHIICARHTFSEIQNTYYLLLNIINKFVATGLVLVFSMLCLYTILISKEKARKESKKLINIFAGLNILFFALTWFCNIELLDAGLAKNANGSLMTLAFAGVAIYLILTLIVTILNFKNDRRYYAIFMILGVLLVLYISAYFIKALIIYDIAMALFCYIMYFSIENPDVKMIKQLEVARDQANKANSAKTEFLSSMSHEIRTPLNAIVGFSDYIMTAETLDEAKENAKDIVNASNTLLEIVNGILDISKIEAGKLEIINSKYNAKETFEGLAKLITPKMNEKSLDFSYYIAPDIPETLFGDHANIKKVVTNLLSNAYKYTDRGFVRYEVNCINTDKFSKLIITVEDSGRGIKQESIDKLFTKFQRLDEDKNTTIEGTGLGLAITKQLIELMGGKILVHTVYGEGSKFTVVLNQRIEYTPVEEHHEVKTTLDLKDKKILIVDDNALNIKVATKILERYNANNITSLDNGFSCIDDIKSGSKYDIILMDDMMPKMTGVETFKKLKEIPEFDMPVVILTANAITGMKEKYMSEGFDEYLAKPIEKDELIRVCNTIFDKYGTSPNEEEIEQLEATEELEVIGEEEIQQPVMNEDNPENYLRTHDVDVDKALEFLGDMEMYNMTIGDFLAEVEEKWQRINSYKEKNDMPNYAIEVHSLKSDAKYLGFMFLADVAYQHELKSKENDVTFVKNYFNELNEAYTKALDIAKTYNEMLK